MSETSTLSARRVAYLRNGFFIHDEPAIEADLVMRAVTGMDELREGRYDTGRPPCESPWKPGDDPNRLCKIENPQFANRAIYELVSHPSLGRLAAEITGAEEIQVWWVQLLYKPCATTNGRPVVGWHQDRTYWDAWTADSDLFTIWVALSDVGPDSGPMRFVPGSHEWGLQSESDFFRDDLDGQAERISPPRGEVWTEVPAILPAGGFSIHHCETLHASGPNFEPMPRRSLAIHARSEKSRPVGDVRAGLTEFIDYEWACPVIYGVRTS
jgi:ectoine hydroxylase-related dioxygenase (phytanoyl-CoA dioxygenase family)